MAKIRKEEIIENGVFSNTIENSKELLKLLNALDSEFVKISKSAKTIGGGLDMKNVGDVDKFLQLHKSLGTQFKESNRVLKDREAIQKKIATVTRQQEKSIENLNAELERNKLNALAINEAEKRGLLTRKEANAQLAKNKTELKATNTALNARIKSVNTLTKSEKLELDIQKAQIGSLKKLRLESKKLREEKDNLNLETKEGAKRLKEINSQLDKNNRALEKNATQLGKQKIGIGKYSQAIKGNIARFVGWTAVISGLTRALRSASALIVNFQKAQADLAGVLGKSRKEIKALTADAKRLGASTIFKPQEVSALQKEFAKLGFGVSSIQNMTKATLDFAVATNTELPRSAEVVGNTLNAFQLNSSQTTRVVNVMNESFSKTALDTERFSIAMGKVAPVANSANYSLEQTTATLGILVSNGIRAETAGTGLRNILQIVAEKGLDLDEVLKDINGSTDRVAKATKLFGKQNAAVAITMSRTTKEADDLTDALTEQGLTAEQVAKEQMDTLSGSIDGLSSAWDGFILALEDGDGVIAKVVRGAINLFTELLQRITDLTRTEASKLQDIVDESASESAQTAGTIFQKLKEDAKRGVNELKRIKKELNAIEDPSKAVTQRIKNIDRLIKAQNDSKVSLRELINIAGNTNLDLGAKKSAKNMKVLEEQTKKVSVLLEKINADEREVQGFNLQLTEGVLLGPLALAEIGRVQDAIDEDKALVKRLQDGIKKLADVATQGDESMKAYRTSLEEAFKPVTVSNKQLEDIVKTGKALQKIVAQEELDRRELAGLTTKSLKGEGGKRVRNTKQYLSKQLALEEEFRSDLEDLDNKFFSQETERLSELNEARISNSQNLIEEETKLQLDRIRAGQEIEFDAIDNLFEEKKKSLIEFNELEISAQKEKNRILNEDEIAKINELELKRKDDASKSGFSEGSDEFNKIDEDIKELRERQEELALSRDAQLKAQKIQLEKDTNEEILDEKRGFYEEVSDIEQEAYEKQKELDEKKADERKEATKELYDTLTGLATAYSEKLIDNANKEIEAIDKQIAASKKQVDAFNNNSTQNKQTIEDNIAFEEAKQAQLEGQKLDQEKKKRQIELATTAVEVYSGKVASDDPNPLFNTIKDITLLQQFVKNLPLFYGGTNTTVGEEFTPSLNTGRDDYIVRVDKKEKILNPYLSSLTGNMTTEEIAMSAYRERTGLMGVSNPFDLSSQSVSISNSMNSVSQMMLVAEMSRQNEKIEQTNSKLDELIAKPVNSIFYDDLGAIPKIVQQTTQGNKTVTKNKFLRG